MILSSPFLPILRLNEWVWRWTTNRSLLVKVCERIEHKTDVSLRATNDLIIITILPFWHEVEPKNLPAHILGHYKRMVCHYLSYYHLLCFNFYLETFNSKSVYHKHALLASRCSLKKKDTIHRFYVLTIVIHNKHFNYSEGWMSLTQKYCTYQL